MRALEYFSVRKKIVGCAREFCVSARGTPGHSIEQEYMCLTDVLGFAILSMGTNGQLIPGISSLPSFVVGPIISQVKNTAASIVTSTIGEQLPLTDIDGNAISTTGSVFYCDENNSKC